MVPAAGPFSVKMYCNCLVIGELKSMILSPGVHSIYGNLQPALYRWNMSRGRVQNEVINIRLPETFWGTLDRRSLIASVNKEQLRTLSCGTPCSCGCSEDSEVSILVLNCLLVKKFLMDIAMFPRIPFSWMDVKIPCLQVRSYAFFMSKKTAMVCSLH